MEFARFHAVSLYSPFLRFIILCVNFLFLLLLLLLISPIHTKHSTKATRLFSVENFHNPSISAQIFYVWYELWIYEWYRIIRCFCWIELFDDGVIKIYSKINKVMIMKCFDYLKCAFILTFFAGNVRNEWMEKRQQQRILRIYFWWRKMKENLKVILLIEEKRTRKTRKRRRRTKINYNYHLVETINWVHSFGVVVRSRGMNVNISLQRKIQDTQDVPHPLNNIWHTKCTRHS